MTVLPCAASRCSIAIPSALVVSAGVKEHVRVHDLRHAALTNLAATGASPIAVMSTAGHRSMSTTMQYVHLAGVVFRDDADALAQRMLGVQGPGTNTPQPVQVSQER